MNKTIPIRVSGHLLEDKLAQLMKDAFPSAELITQYRIPGTKFRMDLVLRGKTHLVGFEFNGPTHYRLADQIIRDVKKENHFLTDRTAVFIPIPYFVQLDNQVFHHFLSSEFCHREFGNDVDLSTDFPHGFISEKIILPADFCSLGQSRFRSDLRSLPSDVSKNIMDSLLDRVNKTQSMMASVFPLYYLTKASNPFARGDKYVSSAADEIVHAKYFDKYKELGGKSSKEEYMSRLELFFSYTLSSCTGEGDRDMAWLKWVSSLRKIDRDNGEPGRIFQSVDLVDAYS